jgi:predicted nuclease of predicted toxin-antitoxin system
MKQILMLDEQISDYKKYLEGFDWVVKTVEDIGKKGAPDIEIIRYAKENNLLFISRNEDAILRAETLDVPYLWVSRARASALLHPSMRVTDLCS